MPIGGSNVNWDETSPAGGDQISLGDDAIRSMKSSVRVGVGSEHNWPTTGGANTGYHLLGSARPFYDVQSNVSSAGSDGRIMVTSDTSNLFHVGSAGTMFLGGQNVLSAVSSPQGGQRFYWAEDFGAIQANGSGSGTAITFANSGFSGAPYVVCSLWSDGFLSNATGPFTLTVRAITKTGFTAVVQNSAGAVLNASSAWTYLYHSKGTRTL